jgi:hypothetical protein
LHITYWYRFWGKAPKEMKMRSHRALHNHPERTPDIWRVETVTLILHLSLSVLMAQNREHDLRVFRGAVGQGMLAVCAALPAAMARILQNDYIKETVPCQARADADEPLCPAIRRSLTWPPNWGRIASTGPAQTQPGAERPVCARSQDCIQEIGVR